MTRKENPWENSNMCEDKSSTGEAPSSLLDKKDVSVENGLAGQDALDVTVVIPAYNESESLTELYEELAQVLKTLDKSYEIIFVDDGSTDDSFAILENLHQKDDRVKVIKLRRNFGKAAALQAGFDLSKGEIIFTMDADLQDDPKEIPRFLETLENGYDLVSGWKKKRHDPWTKKLPSKLFNFVMARFSGLDMHDFNCGYKAYRKELAGQLDLYGELNRYIPVLAAWKGYATGEIVVEHRSRSYGKSKYGVERLMKGFFDFITILITRKYARRPLHVFGMFGALCSLAGTVALGYLSVLWLLGYRPIGNRPLLFFGILFVILGIQLVSFGLVSEMLAKIENRFERGYSISKKIW